MAITSHVVGDILLQINIISRFKPLNLRLMPTSTNGGISKGILVLCNGQDFHCHGHDSFEQDFMQWIINLNPHIGHIPTNGCQLFTPTKQKVKGNDARDICLLNWYPVANQGNYISQSNVCHFYNSYFCKPFSIVCTIF